MIHVFINKHLNLSEHLQNMTFVVHAAWDVLNNEFKIKFKK